jgi:hypothetical protein
VKFKILGASKETGVEVEIVIDATNADTATQTANEMNILVASVTGLEAQQNALDQLSEVANTTFRGDAGTVHNARNAAQGRPAAVQKASVWNRYRDRVGPRSFIFQMMLLGWSACMSILTTGLLLVVLFATVASKPRPLQKDFASINEWSDRYDRWMWEKSHPNATAASDVGSFIMSIACPGSVWFIVALPLGIAAIATLKPKNPIHGQK